MKKNIAICCDGTDNQLTIDKNTNVIHLYSCLVKDENQITYYNPGVGTISHDSIKTSFLRKLYKLRDASFAYSLINDVKQAYIFLMNNYKQDDNIYLFGFSRGAYTVRMLHGMLKMYGLLHKGNEAHLDHILKIYSKDESIWEMANKFKKRFSREVDISFIGIWDKVVSIGNPFSFYKSFQFSADLVLAERVEHCIAIDEKRKHYKVTHIYRKDLHNEVYFAGVHSDIGGSYPEKESGLSKISLEYMMGEVSQHGIRFDKSLVDRYLYGSESSGYTKPDYKQEIHNSLSLLFRIADFLPRIRYKKGNLFNLSVDFSLWPGRKVLDDATLHRSVNQKINDNSCNYSPPNIKKDLLNIRKGSPSYTIVESKSIKYYKS